MTLNIEKEVDTELGFDYEKVIRDVVEAALEFEECPYEIELNVILTSNEEIAMINRDYRDLFVPTDVLSFPMIDYIAPGDFSQLDTYNEEDYFIGDRIDCSLAYKLKNGRTVYRSYAIKSPDYDLWHQFLAAFKNKEAVMQEDAFAVDINDVLYVETTVYQIVTGEEETYVADQSYVLPAAEWKQIRDVLAEDRTKEEDDVFYYGSATGATLTVCCINPELPEEQKAQLRAMTPKEKYDYVSLAGSDMLSDSKKFPVYPEVGYNVYITVQDENAMHLLQSPETRDSAILTLDLT